MLCRATKENSFSQIYLNVVIVLLSDDNAKIPVRNKVICLLDVLCTVQYAACLLGALFAKKLSYM